MSLAQRLAAKRHLNRKQIEVAAWGEDDAPLVIYSGPLTCGDVSRIQRRHPNFLNNPTVDAMIDLIIAKAEDKDGNKLFTLEDKPFLMREPVNLISNISGQMFSSVESVEELGNG